MKTFLQITLEPARLGLIILTLIALLTACLPNPTGNNLQPPDHVEASPTPPGSPTSLHSPSPVPETARPATPTGSLPSLDLPYPVPEIQQPAQPAYPFPSFTPLATSTAEPGSTSTPYPLKKPADDNEGEIVYFTQANQPGKANLSALSVGPDGKQKDTPHLEAEALPAGQGYLSPDGRYFAILADWSSLIVYDRTEKKQLSTFAGMEVQSFYGWHPDSQHVLLQIDRNLWLHDVQEGGENTPLAFHHSGLMGGAAISPDGSKVVYSYVRDSLAAGASVWIIESSGRDAHQLYDLKFAPSNFAWSPNRQTIAFLGEDRMFTFFDPSNLERIKIPYALEVGYIDSPIWSPDSRYFLVSNITNNEKDKGGEIFVFDVTNEQMYPLLKGEIKGFDPTWSPDGLKILFCADIPEGGELWIVDPDGENLQKILHTDQRIGSAAWRAP